MNTPAASNQSGLKYHRPWVSKPDLPGLARWPCHSTGGMSGLMAESAACWSWRYLPGSWLGGQPQRCWAPAVVGVLVQRGPWLDGLRGRSDAGRAGYWGPFGVQFDVPIFRSPCALAPLRQRRLISHPSVIGTNKALAQIGRLTSAKARRKCTPAGLSPGSDP